MRQSLILFFLLGCTVHSYGQRQIPGQLTAGITSGPVDGIVYRNAGKEWKYFITAEVEYINRNRNIYYGAFRYSRADFIYKENILPVETYVLDAGLLFPLFFENSFTFGMVAGPLVSVGYENVNRSDNLLSDGAALQSQSGLY